MKILIPLIFLVLFGLGACEEIIIEKVITDTVWVDKPRSIVGPTLMKTDSFIRVDTVEVKVIIVDTLIHEVVRYDTIYQIVTDSVFIEKLVEVTIVERDTIFIESVVTLTDTVEIIVYDRTVSYRDTLHMPGYVRPTWDVPLDLMPHLEEFSNLAAQYGQPAEIGMLIIHYTDDLPGEGWVSSSFKMGDNDQWVIFLDERLPAELHRSSIMRELGRLSLNKKYSNDPNKIMSPLWRYDREITQQDLDNLFL